MSSGASSDLEAEVVRLRRALARISLATQRTDVPAHVTLDHVGREARAALGGSVHSALDLNQILLSTRDPRIMLQGAPAPAATTLLYRVCDNDEKRFAEALRLVRLFVQQAMLDGAR